MMRKAPDRFFYNSLLRAAMLPVFSLRTSRAYTFSPAYNTFPPLNVTIGGLGGSDGFTVRFIYDSKYSHLRPRKTDLQKYVERVGYYWRFVEGK